MYGFEAFVEGWQKYMFKWDGMGRLFSIEAMITKYRAEVAVYCFQLLRILVSKNHMAAVFYVF